MGSVLAVCYSTVIMAVMCVPSRMGMCVYVVCVGLLYAIVMAWSMWACARLLGSTSLARMGVPKVSLIAVIMVCNLSCCW